MVHYKKILKNHIFWFLLSTAKIGTILLFFLWKPISAKIIKKLAKLKITGIDQHIITIILVYGDFQKNYNLKTIINKNKNVPPPKPTPTFNWNVTYPGEFIYFIYCPLCCSLRLISIFIQTLSFTMKTKDNDSVV